MATPSPFATTEVRWFLEGYSSRHESLRRLFETAAWSGRDDGEPDLYLVVPGADDLGMKWREGALQIKGRLASLGTQLFCGRHQGRVERWVRWSYAGLPAAYREPFARGAALGLTTAAVHKTRAQRKFRLELGGGIVEVDAGAFVDRGVAVELVDLAVGDERHCALAFEAFPDDSGIHAAFTRAVEAFLAELQEPALRAAHSLSYPAWLARRSSR